MRTQEKRIFFPISKPIFARTAGILTRDSIASFFDPNTNPRTKARHEKILPKRMAQYIIGAPIESRSCEE